MKLLLLNILFFRKLFGIDNLHKSFKYSSLLRFKYTVEKIDIYNFKKI